MANVVYGLERNDLGEAFRTSLVRHLKGSVP